MRGYVHLGGTLVTDASFAEVTLDRPAKKNIESALPTGEAHLAFGNVFVQLWCHQQRFQFGFCHHRSNVSHLLKSQRKALQLLEFQNLVSAWLRLNSTSQWSFENKRVEDFRGLFFVSACFGSLRFGLLHTHELWMPIPHVYLREFNTLMKQVASKFGLSVIQ